MKHFLLGSMLMGVTFSAFAKPKQGEIRGCVVESSGEGIPYAQVYLSDRKWAITDGDGCFSINNIPAKSYQISVSKIGFQNFSKTLKIKEEQTLELYIVLEEVVYEVKPIVITASRTKRELEDVSVPITVIDKKEITGSGSLRLSDVLEEQTGITMVSNHGTGVQIQGFDPEYTLILIDNQPVIGRTAGTLDLMRLAIGDVKQIEIVKGPSSALWGSDALAGVINIITERGSEPFTWNATGRYGSNESYDGSSNILFKTNKLSGRFFGNVNGSEGFDLNKNTIAPTVPKYNNYTLSSSLDYRPIKRIGLSLGGRFYSEDQSYRDLSDISDGAKELDGHDTQENYSITPELNFYFGSKQLIEAHSFFSRFKHKNRLKLADSGGPYFQESFDQTLNKFEIKSSTFWSSSQTTVLGAGMNVEGLKGEIFADIPNHESYFIFGQHELEFSKKLSFTGGFRFDAHQEYNSQLSPKFSALYKPNKYVHLKASLGGGFKAPDFSQLFLNFTNPIAGYSVFGATTVEKGIEMTQNSGQIAELYVDPNDIEPIKAEHSFSYNAGIDVFPINGLQLKINGFRNNVTDLIETQRIATKTNGQSIFTYVNLNQIYTQGLEFEARVTPNNIKGLRIGAGYQLLDARRQITREFDKVENGVVISLSEKDYVPMFNRSKHTANLKVYYTLQRLGLDASIRLQHRGKYGFADLNANNKIDGNEYAEAHTIINTSLAKTFLEHFKLQVGVNNITNYQHAQFLPSNPGITFYTQLNIKLY